MVRQHPMPKPWRIAREYELSLDEAAGPQTTNVAVLVEEKPVFDSFQQWGSFIAGHRLTQWEAFTMLMGYAMENPGCEFAPSDRERASRSGSSRTEGPRSSRAPSRDP